LARWRSGFLTIFRRKPGYAFAQRKAQSLSCYQGYWLPLLMGVMQVFIQIVQVNVRTARIVVTEYKLLHTGLSGGFHPVFPC
jgi:hypothetical protein